MLVNRGTASTSELVAGALRGPPHGPGALLVGEHTFGKGRTQRGVPVGPSGALLLVSNLAYVAPDGSPVDRVGLEPAVACVPELTQTSFFASGDAGGGGLVDDLLADPCVRAAAAALGAPLAG